MIRRRRLQAYEPKEKDRVELTYWPEMRGKIIAVGPEVSEVKFDDGRTRYILNTHLVRGVETGE